MSTHLTPEALRAGRAILKWSMRDLAHESGAGVATINALENGQRSRAAHAATIEKIVATFTRHGVDILPPPHAGARLNGLAERV